MACLEPSVFEQFSFINEVISTVYNFLDPSSDSDEVVDAESDPSVSLLQSKCNNEGYQKIKYVSSKASEKNYLDDYESGVIENKILLEVQLELDAFKTESLRTSTQILDFLGDVGGFYQALDLIIFLAAEYFSARYFLASIA